MILTSRSAAELLGITLSSLYRLTSEKRIPHYKPSGKRVYFESDELTDWVRQGRVPTFQELKARVASRFFDPVNV